MRPKRGLSLAGGHFAVGFDKMTGRGEAGGAGYLRNAEAPLFQELCGMGGREKRCPPEAKSGQAAFLSRYTTPVSVEIGIGSTCATSSPVVTP